MFFGYIIIVFLSFSLQAQEVIIKARLEKPEITPLLYAHKKVHTFYNKGERKLAKINDPFLKITLTAENPTFQKISHALQKETDGYIYHLSAY